MTTLSINETVIGIPTHPDDINLPRSVIQLRLPSGNIAALILPIQGEKTLDNAIRILEIWKPTLVRPPALDFQI